MSYSIIFKVFVVKELHRAGKGTAGFRYLPFELKNFSLKACICWYLEDITLKLFFGVIFHLCNFLVVACSNEIASHSCKRIIFHYFYFHIFGISHFVAIWFILDNLKKMIFYIFDNLSFLDQVTLMSFQHNRVFDK